MELLGLLRVSKLVLGLLCGGGLILLAMWLREQWMSQTMLWLCPLSAGQFVLMWMVADDLCPRASVLVTGTLKLATAMVFWVSLLVISWPLGRWLLS